jgi:hypothetical protein
MEMEFESIEFLDGFLVRAGGEREVAYLRKAEGWTQAMADRVVGLADDLYDAGFIKGYDDGFNGALDARKESDDQEKEPQAVAASA